jgi:hypothetical protein
MSSEPDEHSMRSRSQAAAKRAKPGSYSQAIGERGGRVTDRMGLDHPADPKSFAPGRQLPRFQRVAVRIEPRLPKPAERGDERARAGRAPDAQALGARLDPAVVDVKQRGQVAAVVGMEMRQEYVRDLLGTDPGAGELAHVAEAEVEQDDVFSRAHGVARGIAHGLPASGGVAARAQHRQFQTHDEMIKYIGVLYKGAFL